MSTNWYIPSLLALLLMGTQQFPACSLKSPFLQPHKKGELKSIMFEIPALLKVFCVFGLILLLNRMKLTLSLCLLAGAAALALWMKMPPLDLVKSITFSLTQLQTVGLVVIVGMILIISGLMKESGHLERIVSGFSKLSGDERTAGAVMAALIGLLPMPGGALFSAPMVDSAFVNRSISPEVKTAINYWFRHIWEYWWPLYPGVVLAVALLEVTTWKFMAFMASWTFFSVISGYLLILKPVGKSPSGSGWKELKTGLSSFLWEIMPILIVVLVIMLQAAVIGMVRLAGIGISIPGVISIIPGLAASMIWVCRVNHIPIRQIKSAVLDKNILTLIFLVAAIMVFKGILTDSSAVPQIQKELVTYRIPTTLIIMLMPFLSGLISGIAIGFVGISFPLIIPLFPEAKDILFLGHVALAYSFGYMGMMLSPVHLCFLVTKDYYRASLLKCYRYLIPPAVAVMGLTVLVFGVVTAGYSPGPNSPSPETAQYRTWPSTPHFEPAVSTRTSVPIKLPQRLILRDNARPFAFGKRFQILSGNTVDSAPSLLSMLSWPD